MTARMALTWSVRVLHTPPQTGVLKVGCDATNERGRFNEQLVFGVSSKCSV